MYVHTRPVLPVFCLSAKKGCFRFAALFADRQKQPQPDFFNAIRTIRKNRSIDIKKNFSRPKINPLLKLFLHRNLSSVNFAIRHKAATPSLFIPFASLTSDRTRCLIRFAVSGEKCYFSPRNPREQGSGLWFYIITKGGRLAGGRSPCPLPCVPNSINHIA